MEFSAVNRRRPSRETPLGPGAKKDGCFRRLTSHKQVLRTGKRVVVGVLICSEIYFDVPDMNSACERT